jgi:glycosyltransferase involved in cell wall biosynthesis
LKKVLLITYYFEPGNAVATPRVMSWANEFHQYGIELTVVTRHFTGKEAHWLDFIVPTAEPLKIVNKENYSIHYLPYTIQKPSWAQSNPLFSKVYHFFKFISGHFNIEIDAYAAFGDYCKKLLSEEQYHLILVSAPPHNLARLAYELNRIFKIPYAVDFRDIWNNLLTGSQKHVSLQQRWMNKVEEFFIARWLHKASFVTTVSQALVEQVKRIYNGKCLELTNGYELKKFQKVSASKPLDKKFVFSSIGTIYPMQNTSLMVEGLKKFYETLEHKEMFEVRFIGLRAIETVASEIAVKLEGLNPVITQKLSRAQVMDHYTESHVLFFPAWPEHKGMYSTKMFEYIGSGRKIIIAPGDNDVVERLVRKSGRGYVANTVDEFVIALREIFNQWQSGTYEVMQPSDEEMLFSREKQAEILAKQIIAVA